MKIGHFASGLFNPGGISNYIQRVSRAQQESGHEVLLFDLLGEQHNQKASLPEGVFVQYVSDDTHLLQKACALEVDVLHLHTAVAVGERPPLTVIRTLHGHQPYCPSGSRYLARPGKPCDRAYSVAGCLWGHFVNRCGSVRPVYLKQDFQQMQQERKTFDWVPIITISDYQRRQVLAQGYLSERVSLLYNSAPDWKEPSPPLERTPRPRFVFVGRMTPEKGVDWLIKAVAETKDLFDLDLIGEGPIENEHRELVSRLYLKDRITFHGWLSSEEVRQKIIRARCLVFPSVWHEPAGLVATEAMACSRAVIASSVGGIPEYVQHEVNGLLVKPHDTAGLASAMERLATDDALADRLGQNGRRISMERFSFENHVQTLFGLYEKYGRLREAHL